jgi:hypothetical protein
MFDYFLEYGNDDFKTLPFNEVDAAILCQLSYLNLEILVPRLGDNKEDFSILEFNHEELLDPLTDRVFAPQDNKKMLNNIFNSKRYSDLKINYLDFNTCFEAKEQFYAVTFIIDNVAYITYRGTDMTLVGWREDFDMAYMKEVPAQRKALDYLKKVAKISQLPLGVQGHSKGGNLAVYSAMYISKEIQDRIIHIYDFDGPGFNEHVYDLEEYKEIESRVLRRIADKTVIGLLMYHTDKYELVKTSGVSILRHLLFNWHVNKGATFRRATKLDFNSQVIASTVINYLAVTDADERRDFVNKLFFLLEENPKLTLFDIKDNFRGYTKSISKRYREMTMDDKLLFKIYIIKLRKAYVESIKVGIKQRLSKKKIDNK